MTKNNKDMVDLHVHTSYSDGMFSPEEVVKKSREMELKAIAITDHDCIGAIVPCMEAAKGMDIEIIRGIELSAKKDETEIHILGYFIDEKNPSLLKTLDELKKDRIIVIKKMMFLLRQEGLTVTDEKVFKENSKGTIGRLNLARVVVEENISMDIKTVFDKYIGDSAPFCVKHKNLDYKKAIELIKNAGGVAVLAHPGTMGKDEYIPDYVEAGLRGIEAFHLRHRPDARARYSAVAEKYDLILTGGSDCHGGYGKKILLGREKIEYQAVINLRRESEKYGRKN